MSEQPKPIDPELDKALRAYEVEMLDGTERSQQLALQSLRAVRRRLQAQATPAGGEGGEMPESTAS